MAATRQRQAGDLPSEEQLLALLAELRAEGLHLVPDQLATAVRVLRRARATWPVDTPATRLAHALTPVLAKTPEQQEQLHWRLARRPGTPPPQSEPPEPDEAEKVSFRPPVWRVAFTLLLALAGAMAAVAIAWSISTGDIPADEVVAENTVSERTDPTPAPPESNDGVAVILLLAAFASGAILALSAVHRARALAVVRLAGEEPPSLEVGHRPFGTRLFARPELGGVARRLRRFRQVATRALDEKRTIEATIDSGGVFTPVCKMRPLSPKYVFLVEERSRQDHVARLMDTLLDRLVDEGVDIQRYYFSNDLRRLRPAGDTKGRSITLPHLTHSDRTMLVIVGDSAILFGAGTELERELAAQLEAFPQRALLTTTPVASWTQREIVLCESGYLVGTARERGFHALGLSLQRAGFEDGAFLDAAVVSRAPRRHRAPPVVPEPSREVLERDFAALLARASREADEARSELRIEIDAVRDLLSRGELEEAFDRAAALTREGRLRLDAPRLMASLARFLRRSDGIFSAPQGATAEGDAPRPRPDEEEFSPATHLPGSGMHLVRQLADALRDTSSPPTLLLVGEPGVGKSTAARQVADVLGQDWQVERISHYPPISATDLIGELFDRFKLGAAPQEPRHPDAHIFEAAARALAALDRSTLIIVDDIDVLDLSTKALIESLVRSLGDSTGTKTRLLLIGRDRPYIAFQPHHVRTFVIDEEAIRVELMRGLERAFGAERAAKFQSLPLHELQRLAEKMLSPEA